MNLSATADRRCLFENGLRLTIDEDALAADSRYLVRLARNNGEVGSALRLRHEVFRVEMGAVSGDSDMEFDAFDFRSKHLLVIERSTQNTIGTYRLNSISSIGDISLLYSHQEFEIERLPSNILLNSAEVGRACIAPGHRNTKALFILWKGLAKYLVLNQKRYLFGCCSIFTKNPNTGAAAYNLLAEKGHLHPEIRILPRKNALNLSMAERPGPEPALPQLFEMYLRLGARVCGAPMIDHSFGTIDFFVLFDLEAMNAKYKRMFLGRT